MRGESTQHATIQPELSSRLDICKGKFSSIENNEGAQILGFRRVLGNGFGEKKKKKRRMLWPKAPLPSGLRSRAGGDTARSGAGLIPRTFGPARGHPSGSPASFRCPLTRCRAPVQQAV